MNRHLQRDTDAENQLRNTGRAIPKQSNRAKQHKGDWGKGRPHAVPPGKVIVVKVIRVDQRPKRVYSDLRKPDNARVPNAEQHCREEDPPSSIHKRLRVKIDSVKQLIELSRKSRASVKQLLERKSNERLLALSIGSQGDRGAAWTTHGVSIPLLTAAKLVLPASRNPKSRCHR
jgi:hypothetical protein